MGGDHKRVTINPPPVRAPFMLGVTLVIEGGAYANEDSRDVMNSWFGYSSNQISNRIILPTPGGSAITIESVSL